MIDIKKQFPIFKTETDLVYLDNAATTQMPQVVLDAITKYNTEYRANIHRGIYKLSELSSQKYEEGRQSIAKFINAETNEIIFTAGATQGLNGLANSLGKKLNSQDNIVLTRMEHHANLIPWQIMSREYGFEIRFIELDKNYALDLESAKKVIDKNTKIVSFVHISNTLGTINKAKEIVELVKQVNAISIVDGAQSIAHMKVDVKKIDCDFFVFSGHKIGGPTGIGVIYGKKKKLEDMNPFVFGGGMITEVNYNEAKWDNAPHKFEAGTPNISGAIGLATAVEFLMSIGMDNIEQHEKKLTDYAIGEFDKIKQLKIIGPKDNRASVISFVIDGIHPHDVATMLDRENIAVRAGNHCTEPLMDYLGVNGTTRASFWIYNTINDINKLLIGIKKTIKLFNV